MFNNPFAKPSAKVLAIDELEDAKRQLLVAEKGYEYSKAMVSYHKAHILKLEVFVRAELSNDPTAKPLSDPEFPD